MDTTSSDTHDSPDYSVIPEDFPRPDVASSLAGYQSKLALVSYEGKLYIPGGTPPELFQRWDICEDLATKFAARSLVTQKGKYSHLSETEILAQYCSRMMETGWGSDEEMRWVIRRVAEMLSWPIPEIAKAHE
jgi:hypothetical protein